MDFRPFTTVVIDEDDTAPRPTHGSLSDYVGGDAISFRMSSSRPIMFVGNLNVRFTLVLSRDAVMTFEGDDGATFSARELHELLEWVRANRAPPRMAPIDAAAAAPPDDGV